MHSLPLFFHPDARVDALEAYDWYAKRSQQAADAFREELHDAGGDEGILRFHASSRSSAEASLCAEWGMQRIRAAFSRL